MSPLLSTEAAGLEAKLQSFEKLEEWVESDRVRVILFDVCFLCELQSEKMLKTKRRLNGTLE